MDKLGNWSISGLYQNFLNICILRWLAKTATHVCYYVLYSVLFLV